MPPGGDGWNEWRRHVLAELSRLAEYSQELREDIKGIVREMKETTVQIGMLKVKAGVWGLLGAMIPVVVALAIMYMKSPK